MSKESFLNQVKAALDNDVCECAKIPEGGFPDKCLFCVIEAIVEERTKLLEMNLYIVSRTDTVDYDEFDSVVVAAESEDDARSIHPSGYVISGDFWMGFRQGDFYPVSAYCYGWVAPGYIDTLKVKHIGSTDEPRGVILASFNAG